MVFKYEIGNNIKDEKRDLTITNTDIIEDVYFNTRDNKQRISRKQFYEYKCNKCGYIGNIRESDLKNSKGCSCCAGKIVAEGINDIPTTAPWMIPYFQGGYDEAKLYSYGSHTKIYPICPDCGKVKNKLTTINEIHRIHSIGCTCGDGVSYPEKFFISLLNQLNINYIYQPSKTNFNWINNNIRYDFYISELNMICEINGLQHYEGNYEKLSGHDLEYEQNNDKFKKDLAIKNGIINYIYIDCRKSELQWIKNSILETDLPNLLKFKEDDIDWIKCGEYACKNLVKEVCDYATKNPKLNKIQLSQIFKVHSSTITRYIREGKQLGWYEKPLNIEKEKPIFKTVKSQPIMCINNGLIFSSMNDCSRQSFLVFGVLIYECEISQICSGKMKQSKGYVFQKITKEQYVELLNKQKNKEVNIIGNRTTSN